MPQFTAPRPATAGALRKPRNPMVAPSRFRAAGRHQSPQPRQLAQQQLRDGLRDLFRPPSID